MPKSGLARIGRVSGPLAYVGALTLLLGGTFFAVVTFLSFAAEVDTETAVERLPPRPLRDSEKARPLPRLFETKIGPPVVHPSPPGGGPTLSKTAVVKAKANGQAQEYRNATVTTQPTIIFQERRMTSSKETDLSIDHFFTR
jgi:hypothetical protein